MRNNYIKGLVSVILPTYNRPYLFPHAIESVIKQTYQNWELFIIGDGCKNDIIEIAKPFLSDQRIKFILLDKNIGNAEARNVGIRASNGEFLAFLDDDDEWLVNKLETQLKIFQNNNDTAIVSCNYYKVKDNKIKKFKSSLYNVSLEELLFEYCLGSFSFLLTKNIFTEGLEINPRFHIFGDYDLCIKILLKSKLKSFICQEYLVKHRVSGDDRISKNLKLYYLDRILFLRTYWKMMNQEQRNYNLCFLILNKIRIKNYEFIPRLKLLIKAAEHFILSKRKANPFLILKVFFNLLQIKKSIV